jgi:hypothetical protein
MPRSKTPFTGVDPAGAELTSSENWLDLARRQFDAVLRLQPGWDSNGADAPDPKLVGAAKALLENLCAGGSFPKPHISPTRSGGIQFEWEADGRYFEIEVTGEREATYLYQDTAARIEEAGTLREGEGRGKLLAYVDRVTSE